jgi:single-stranded-DNA-specific exonuclease
MERKLRYYENIFEKELEMAKWRPRSTEFVDQDLWGDGESLPPLVKLFAQARGFKSNKEFDSWLNPKLLDLRDPFLLKGMTSAIERLVRAYKNNEIVALYGDFDLDGTSALALLDRAFSVFGFKNYILYQPARLAEGYGFHVAAVENLKDKGVKLIVTVDVGTTALLAAKKCSELEIDLIITDHHLPLQELPEAYSFINPNQEECTAGLGHLCGVGVAFYLIWALRRMLIQEKMILESQLDMRDLLDCFVIGTLTDMVPLIAENRVLVKHGLHRLAQTSRWGLRLLLDELSLWGRELSSQDVAIRFAPKLNALSRMELGLKPLDIFTAGTMEEAEILISKVLRQNEMRMQLQSDAEFHAKEEALKWETESFIFVCSKEFHRGIIGLVATRLSQIYQKPSFVGAISNDGIVVSSARTPSGIGSVNLVKVLEYASLYLHRFGGHTSAAGFEFQFEQFENIIQNFKDYFLDLDKTEVEHEIVYDLQVSLNDVNASLMKWLDSIGPFGQAFEIPLFYFSGVRIVSVKKLKGAHLRLSLAENDSRIDGLLFSPSENQLEVVQNNSVVDILAELQWNYYQNQKSIQLLVKEVRRPIFQSIQQVKIDTLVIKEI